MNLESSLQPAESWEGSYQQEAGQCQVSGCQGWACSFLGLCPSFTICVVPSSPPPPASWPGKSLLGSYFIRLFSPYLDGLSSLSFYVVRTLGYKWQKSLQGGELVWSWLDPQTLLLACSLFFPHFLSLSSGFLLKQAVPCLPAKTVPRSSQLTLHPSRYLGGQAASLS